MREQHKTALAHQSKIFGEEIRMMQENYHSQMVQFRDSLDMVEFKVGENREQVAEVRGLLGDVEDSVEEVRERPAFGRDFDRLVEDRVSAVLSENARIEDFLMKVMAEEGQFQRMSLHALHNHPKNVLNKFEDYFLQREHKNKHASEVRQKRKIGEDGLSGF